MAEQSSGAAGRAGGSLLAAISQELADVVSRVGASVVRVEGRRRLPASGVVWATGAERAQGVVVTADHALEVEEGIVVGLPDGREARAHLAGRDPGSDLAVLRVEATGLTPAQPAEPSSGRVGSLVLAVARPGGDGPRATGGVVSARTGPWRTWRGGRLESLIQTDVTFYPGFSGGALVDVAGRLLGVNTSGLARGVSVAVPVGTVGRVVGDLLARGRVRRGYLGVSTQPVALPPPLLQRLGLTQGSGLLLVGVEPGGPADAAGLLLGDVLVGLAGQPLRDTDDLQALLGAERVGVEAPAVVIRAGSLVTCPVTVGERPG